MTTNEWFYKDVPVSVLEDLEPGAVGFVYKITDTKNNQIYIGKKSLFSNRKKKLTKKELENLPPKRGKKSTHKRVIEESNWKDYYGSSKLLLEQIKKRGVLEFRRDILIFCKTLKQLTYWEMHYQCVYEVLLAESYNESILGKFFPKDLK